ncbi:hypothetical protein CCMA1212_006305 [Trichoderma ghanense]|uniref:Uncharacterized protein n=1 Tax=Trichoderma ghanense TaxID=65468 RepID=A0ABY2H1I4_9HYPO
MHAASPVVPLRSRGLPQRNAQLKPPEPQSPLEGPSPQSEKPPPETSQRHSIRPKHGCQSQREIRHQSDTSPVMPVLPSSHGLPGSRAFAGLNCLPRPCPTKPTA